MLDQLLENVKNIRELEENAEDYINEHFDGIKRQVEMRRKDLKLKIDSYSDDMVRSIESTRLECMKSAKEVNWLTTQLERSNKELGELIERFEFEFECESEAKAETDINSSAASLNDAFLKLLNDYQRLLVKNKEYTFEFLETPIDDVFGRFSASTFDSKILETSSVSAFNKLCEFSGDEEWLLLYRASRDGFDAADFHLKCDGFGNTLTVIKTTNDFVFGGFTEKAWQSTGNYVTDPNAFIFSLVNKEQRPLKVKCSESSKIAINCLSECGPLFGFDIVIESRSNLKESSYSFFGSSYIHPDYPVCSDRAKNFLAGSVFFQTAEIEVFHMN